MNLNNNKKKPRNSTSNFKNILQNKSGIDVLPKFAKPYLQDTKYNNNNSS